MLSFLLSNFLIPCNLHAALTSAVNWVPARAQLVLQVAKATLKLFPPFLCFVYPFLGTQMSAVVTYCREASGSDGCHNGGGSYWRCSASSVMQTPLLNSHFLAPTPLSDWLLNGQRVNPTDGLNGRKPRCYECTLSGCGESNCQSGISKLMPITQLCDDSTEICHE